MSRFSRLETFSSMLKSPIIPVFYHQDLETAKQVVAACYAGGIRAFEFTNRGDYAHEIFADLNKWAAQECPDLILGIGSIVDAPTAAIYIQLGANFIVGPLLNPDIFKVCNRRQIAYIPGCGSVTEVGLAQEFGAEVIKVFPGDVVGPAFIKGVKAPMPWSKMMVTGGVSPTEENLKKWFDAGVFCVGMGSNLFPKEIIASKEWTRITQLCRDALSIVERVRTLS